MYYALAGDRFNIKPRPGGAERAQAHRDVENAVHAGTDWRHGGTGGGNLTTLSRTPGNAKRRDGTTGFQNVTAA
jgi:hypothetical protein